MEEKTSGSNAENMTIEIPMEEGDPLGATPDQQMVIIQVQKDTLAEGKLQVGDKILTVNGRSPKDVRSFFHLLNVAAREQDKAILNIRRDSNKAKELDAHNQIPPNRAKFIRRREGFLYKLVSIAYQKGQKLGLSIKQRQNHVLITNVKPGTLSARVFEYLDHILDIDGQPVTDTSVTESLIREGFKSRQFFTAVISRPASDEARRQVQEELNRSSTITPEQSTDSEEPSVKMADDVHGIAEREITRMRNQQAPEASSIVVEPGTRHPMRPVINDRPVERQIASDIRDGVELKHIGLIHTQNKQ